MYQPTAALLALAALAANEPTALEKLRQTRRMCSMRRETSGTNRAKVKAARKQRQKSKR